MLLFDLIEVVTGSIKLIMLLEINGLFLDQVNVVLDIHSRAANEFSLHPPLIFVFIL
jgi:hypothetical protein